MKISEKFKKKHLEKIKNNWKFWENLDKILDIFKIDLNILRKFSGNFFKFKSFEKIFKNYWETFKNI